jgi:hypothetical protein
MCSRTMTCVCRTRQSLRTPDLRVRGREHLTLRWHASNAQLIQNNWALTGGIFRAQELCGAALTRGDP